MTLAFVCIQLDTGIEIYRLMSCQKVCYYLVSDMGGGRSRQTVTNGDKGEGGKKLGFSR